MPPTAKRFVDVAFGRRLTEASDNSKHVPGLNKGRYVWISEQFGRLGQNVTVESVRKWYSGEARPRPAKMSALARILRVDEAWLSLGVTPELSLDEKAERSIHAGGAVNFVAGLVQLGGGTIAFVEPRTLESAYADFFAILKGKAHLVKVSFGLVSDSEVKLIVPNEHDRLRVIALLKEGTDKFRLYEIPTQVAAKHGKQTGGHVEVLATKKGDDLLVKKTQLPAIRDFETYDFAA